MADSELFERVSSKNSEIWKHYTRNFQTNEYRCIYCNITSFIKNTSTNDMYNHLVRAHSSKVAKLIVETPTLVYRSKNRAIEQNDADSEQRPSYEWLDRLALDGFPIRDILSSIYTRYQEDSKAFGKYLIKRATSLKNCKYKVKNFLPKLPLMMYPKEISPLLMDKYRISEEGANLLLEDFLWVYQNDQEVIATVQRKGMTVYRYEQDRVLSVLVFCDQRMRSNYEKFGDAVSLEFHEHHIIKKGDNQNYYAGIFTGQDTSIRPIIFGVALIRDETYQNYSLCLKYFFRAMRIKKLPACFIVNCSQLLIQAVENLSASYKQRENQTFKCVIGWHHLIQNFIKKCKHLDIRDQLLSKLSSVLNQVNESKMNLKIEELKAALHYDAKLAKFLDDYSAYFMANLEPVFIGYCMQKNHFSFLHKATQAFFKESENLGFFFLNALKLQELFTSRLAKGLELINHKQFETLQILLTDELKYLSVRLERPLFKKFLENYKIAVNDVRIAKRSHDNLSYQIIIPSGSRFTPVYTVKYNLASCCWECNCNFVIWSGLPCAHLIKMIRRFKGSLSYYINRRWMIRNNKFNPDLISCREELQMQPQFEPEGQLEEVECCFQDKIPNNFEQQQNQQKWTPSLKRNVLQNEVKNEIIRKMRQLKQKNACKISNLRPAQQCRPKTDGLKSKEASDSTFIENSLNLLQPHENKSSRVCEENKDEISSNYKPPKLNPEPYPAQLESKRAQQQD